MKNLKANKIWDLLKNILIGMILLSFSISSTYAQANDKDILETINDKLTSENVNQYVDDKLSVYRCFAKGNVDFILFLNAVIYSDGFVEGVIEPFNDVLFRNNCHVTDVSNLIKKRDQVRSAIRKAFLECRNDRIPQLKRGYNIANLEVYYVRHVVNAPALVGLPIDYLVANPSQFYTATDTLYKDMSQRYVDSGIFSKDDFDILFANLEAKYVNKKETYVVCESGSFKELKTKFTEFIDNLGGLKEGFDYADKKLGGRIEKINEALLDQGVEDFINNLVQVNVNNNNFYDEANKFLDYFDKINYSPDFNNLTSRDVVKTLSNAEFEFKKENYYNSMSSKFDVLYKNSSDSTIESFMNEMNGLNIIIIDSLDSINGILNCVYTMNSRQCPGTT